MAPKTKKPATEEPPAKKAKEEEAVAEEPKKEEEPEKKWEEPDAPKDNRPAMKETIAFEVGDITLNAVPSLQGKMLMMLTEGALGFLTAGARASVAQKGGRYFFESKIAQFMTPNHNYGYGRGGQAPKQLFRIGFSTSNSSLILGDDDQSICFDSDGSFISERNRQRSHQAIHRSSVLGVVLNLDPKSPNFNTVALYIEGKIAGEPKPLPEGLKGKALFPHVSYRNVSVYTNFGPTPQTALPFKCTMLQSAAQSDVVAAVSKASKDGKYEVLFPVAFPDEGTFDWLDTFMEKNPKYVELSDRKLLDWARASGLWPRDRGDRRISNDKPAFNFGIPVMDDLSVRRVLTSVAPTLPRNYVVMEVKSNLIAEERKETLKRFSNPCYKKIAKVVMGDPSAEFKTKVKNKILKDKQERSDYEWKMKQAEKARKKESEQRRKEYDEQAKKRREEREAREAEWKAKQEEDKKAKEDAEKKEEPEKKEEEKPAEEGEKPAEEGEKPAEEGEKPAEEGEKPAEEGEKPAEEGEKPKEAAEEVKKEEVKAEEEEPKKADEPMPDAEVKKEEEVKEEEKEEEKEETEPPVVELTEEEAATAFVPKRWPDLSSQIMNTSFTKFTTPEKGEGFDDVQYEWDSSAKAAEYLKTWVMNRKLNTRIEDLKPGEEFTTKMAAFSKLFQEWQDKVKSLGGAKPVEKKESAEGEEKTEEKEEVEIDVNTIADIYDMGEGVPLFGQFQSEDWALTLIRFELFMLTTSFKKDCNDPDRAGIPLDHVAFYYYKYFNKVFTNTTYGKADFKEVYEMVKDTVTVKDGLLVSALEEDNDSTDVFVKLTEAARRERSRRIDAGDETARLKFPPPAPARAAPPPPPEMPDGSDARVPMRSGFVPVGGYGPVGKGKDFGKGGPYGKGKDFGKGKKY